MQSGEIVHDGDDVLKEICGLSLTLNDVSMDNIINLYADKNRIELMYAKYFTCQLVGNYKVNYSKYLLDNNGVNQVQWVTNRLKNNKESKSATIGLHKAGEDYLSCLSLLDFKIRNEQLRMGVVFRSQNAYASHPGNMLALRKIQEDIAKELKISVGVVELVVWSSHVYAQDFAAVDKILSKF